MKRNTILVIAVHPDDETLGCGGTLLKHKYNGDMIHWLICTSFKNNNYKKRKKEIQKVQKLYDFDSVNNLNLKATKIDKYGMDELIKLISSQIYKIKPDTIYLPFHGDVHSDHKKIFHASYSCTKSFRYPFIKKIYMMEVLSETEFAPSINQNSFIPNTFVDISEFIDKKIEIMNTFKSEISTHPFPRSEENIRALALHRGAMINSKYAESFMLLKEIQ